MSNGRTFRIVRYVIIFSKLSFPFFSVDLVFYSFLYFSYLVVVYFHCYFFSLVCFDCWLYFLLLCCESYSFPHFLLHYLHYCRLHLHYGSYLYDVSLRSKALAGGVCRRWPRRPRAKIENWNRLAEGWERSFQPVTWMSSLLVSG